MITRPITTKDASALLAYFTKLVDVDRERVERPEDVAGITLEMEEKWVSKLIEKELAGEMVVRVGLNDTEEVVVLAEVERKTRWIERHVAEIRFGMSPGHEAVAAHVLEECIQKAKVIGITDLVYFHLTTQVAGIEVMKQLGFTECGLVPRYYKRDEEYIGRIYLHKTI